MISSKSRSTLAFVVIDQINTGSTVLAINVFTIVHIWKDNEKIVTSFTHSWPMRPSHHTCHQQTSSFCLILTLRFHLSVRISEDTNPETVTFPPHSTGTLKVLPATTAKAELIDFSYDTSENATTYNGICNDRLASSWELNIQNERVKGTFLQCFLLWWKRKKVARIWFELISLLQKVCFLKINYVATYRDLSFHHDIVSSVSERFSFVNIFVLYAVRWWKNGNISSL